LHLASNTLNIIIHTCSYINIIIIVIDTIKRYIKNRKFDIVEFGINLGIAYCLSVLGTIGFVYSFYKDYKEKGRKLYEHN
jgi:hypothetical protein